MSKGKISVTFIMVLVMLAYSAWAAEGKNTAMPSASTLFIMKFLNDSPARLYQDSQVISATNTDSSKSNVVIYALEKDDFGWKVVFGPIEGNIGRNGFADAGEKREGDGKSPSGVFPLGTAFGYGAAINSRMPYRQSTTSDFWVDDVSSPFYNRWDRGAVAAVSAEKMRREDDLYKYGIVIEYNTGPVIRGHGSAIFFHIWRGKGKPTAGCVSMSENDLVKILAWLDPAKKPVAVMGTEAQLGRLR